MQRIKKPVSRAQFRFFIAMLDRIEAGMPSAMKGVTAEQLRDALKGVDYASLPERAQAAPKSKPQPSRARQPLPAVGVPVPATAHVRPIDVDAYLASNPGHALNRDAAFRKHVAGSFIFPMEPNGPAHWLLRTKTAVKAVQKRATTIPRCRLWSLAEARAFLSALGTVVKTPQEAAQQMAYCAVYAEGVPREELPAAPARPVRQSGLPPELRDADVW